MNIKLPTARLIIGLLGLTASLHSFNLSLGGDSSDVLFSGALLPGGVQVFAGTSNSLTDDLPGNSGKDDIWVTALNAQGSLLYTQNFGSSGYDQARQILPTSDGGFLIAGRTMSGDQDMQNCGFKGASDVALIKLNNIGQKQWVRCFGGSLTDWNMGVIQLSDGSFVLANTTYSRDGDLPPGPAIEYGALWIARVSPQGVLQQQRVFAGANFRTAEKIINTRDGGFAVVGALWSMPGETPVTKGYSDTWVLKFSATGVLEFEKTWGGSSVENGYDIVQTADNGFLILSRTYSTDGDLAGNNNGRLWFLKLDAQGNVQKNSFFGELLNGGVPYMVSLNNGSNYAVAYSIYDDQLYDKYVRLDYLDAQGSLLAYKNYNGSGIEDLHGLLFNGQGLTFLVQSNSNDGDVPNRGILGPNAWVFSIDNLGNIIP